MIQWPWRRAHQRPCLIIMPAVRSVSMIAIVNKSTLTTSADLAVWSRACALQVRYHLAPAYDASPRPVVFFEHESMAPPGSWPVYVLDDPDVAQALGYHDVDPQGRPYGRVFARPTLAAGVSLSSVLSHEVCEAAVDPDVNLWGLDARHGRLHAWEACDAVENDSYVVKVTGNPAQGGTHRVEVSNFVTPAWYNAADAGGRYDHLGVLTSPFQLSKGGYTIVAAIGRESQVFGTEVLGERYAWRAAVKAASGSRSLRRAGKL